ncbi:MAG: efflux RND transporter periplasmic adaptor subunit [Halioglobus sp.]
MERILAGAALLTALTSSVAALADNTGSGEATVQVTTTAVIARTVTQTLSVFGVLDPDPDQVLSLSLPHAGLINRVWVRLGQRVSSGDPLLEVITDPDAHMQYLQAKGAVDFATQEFDRLRRLLADQLATRSELEAARKNLDDANASLKALQERGLDLAQDTLRAPMDGIITQLDVAQGQRLQADTSAMLIAAEQKLVARLGVEPEDLARVNIGAPVTITSVFVPDVAIATSIREVHAMIDPASHLVEVLAPIPADRNEHLVLGSRILGQVQLASHTALLVPRNAVLSDAEGEYLFTAKDGVASRTAVVIGIEEGDLVEVSGDLRAGDLIISYGSYELADGMPVREAP